MKLSFAFNMIAAFASVLSTPVLTKVSVLVSNLVALPLHVEGRVHSTSEGYERQWPGTYFEGNFMGTTAYVKVGPGDVSLRVRVDQAESIALVRPETGLYRLTGLPEGKHHLRVDVASESVAGPTYFGGLYVPVGSALPAPAPRAHQIEFIGDSHTVGYGNTSTTRDCTEDKVWKTTDTTRGIAAVTALTFNADYRVNAISGRGIVRNYNGFLADTLPQAYPYTLFDKAELYRDSSWNPQVVVIALGTNDFATGLQPTEPWKTRDDLHAAYEHSYEQLVEQVHKAHPTATVVLWSLDLSNGEITAEVDKVVAALKRRGDSRVGALALSGLSMSGCHYHPSVSDDVRIADSISSYIRSKPDIWGDETMEQGYGDDSVHNGPVI